jgi:tetratricopeptide (TPR) repeat protein
MTMVDRTAESINEATRHFLRALETDDVQLRAFVHTGLGFCYAQQVHRLGKLDEEVLTKAYEHAQMAEDDWRSFEQKEGSCPNPVIPYTKALVSLSDYRQDDDEGRDERERSWHAARLCVEAIEFEEENAEFYNMLGYILLKFAARGDERLPPDLEIRMHEVTRTGRGAGGSEQHIGELAEEYLHRACMLQPRGKLAYANLCLLYSTAYFRKQPDNRYLARCRHNGLKALDLDPDYINGYRDLTIALVRYGELDEAKPYYEAALELADDPEKQEEIISNVCGELEKPKKGTKLAKKELEWWKHPPRKLRAPRPAPKEPMAEAKADGT